MTKFLDAFQQNDVHLCVSSCAAHRGRFVYARNRTSAVLIIIICDIIASQNSFNDEPDQPKSILVFLPGLAEIYQFMEYLREYYTGNFISKKLELIPLHSSLNEDEQERAFKHVDKMMGKRKVIIATNIAESSITIPDVKYVIDFLLTKELYYDPVGKSESLQLNWCSKASAK